MPNKVVELPKLEVGEEIKVGGNGHKLSLRQKIARWLLKDAHIDELHIGAHSIVIDGDQIKMNALAADPGAPVEGWIWYLAGAAHKPRHHDGTSVKDIGEGATPGAHKTEHENGGGDEISVAGLSGALADAQTPAAHNLGGAEHNADTLANLNTKVSDATLDKNTDKRDPNVHAADHVGAADPIQDATAAQKGLATDTQITKLDGIADGADVTADNAPKAHKASHQAAGADELDLTGMKADNLAEKTADTGITLDGCLIKDGKAADSNLLEASSKATVQDHTPKAHKASHESGGGDELFNQNLNTTDNVPSLK